MAENGVQEGAFNTMASVMKAHWDGLGEAYQNGDVLGMIVRNTPILNAAMARTEAGYSVGQMLDATLGMPGEAVGTAVSGIKDFGHNVAATVSGAVDGIAEGIGNTVDTIKDAAHDIHATAVGAGAFIRDGVDFDAMRERGYDELDARERDYEDSKLEVLAQEASDGKDMPVGVSSAVNEGAAAVIDKMKETAAETVGKDGKNDIAEKLEDVSKEVEADKGIDKVADKFDEPSVDKEMPDMGPEYVA